MTKRGIIDWTVRVCVSGNTTQPKMSCAPRIAADRNYANIAQPAEKLYMDANSLLSLTAAYTRKKSLKAPR